MERLISAIVLRAVQERVNPVNLIMKVVAGWGNDNIERIAAIPAVAFDEVSIADLIELGVHARPAYGLIKSLEAGHHLAEQGVDINEPLETTLATIEWLREINANQVPQIADKGK